MNYKIKEPIAIDISFWESDIRWKELSPRPDIIIAKASEYKWTDPKFIDHWQNMTRSAVPRGAYHFFRGNDVSAQVSTYLEQMQKAGAWDGTKWLAEVAPILDAEYEPPAMPKKKPKNYIASPRGTALASQYKAWLDAVESATNVRPIIYTSLYYWSFTFDWAGKPPAWSSDYPLWLAYYPDRPDDFTAPTAGMLPKGWGLDNIILWQYAEDGRLYGIPYDGVDLNWVSAKWLNALNEMVPPIPINDEPIPTPGQEIKRNVRQIIFDDGEAQNVLG